MNNMPTFDEIRHAILRDTLSLNPEADVSSDSDHYIRASSLASCAVGQYAHQAWILRQFFPDTADTAYLERHCSLHGLKRKNATYATGVATVNGVADAQIKAGLQIKCDELFFTVRDDARIGAEGTAHIQIISSEAGTRYDVADMAAQFMSAPAGVASELQIIKTTGGTDAETDTELLLRLLELLRRPPAGGNQYDYKNWALSVDGVTSAYVYPLRRGLGTVDIVITSAGDVPSDDIVQKVQDYIDAMRPVTAKNSFVIKPNVTLVDINVAVKLSGVTLITVTNDIKTALAEYFDSIQPGDAVVMSQIEAVISNIAGVVDRKLTIPNANLIPDMLHKVEWFRLGKVTVTAGVTE
ncbi:baseplate J/gp47 family protein [Neisseriaceae bacterium ESL0693]|nr:baseplate J/gp47 family protein [Neisseriaceae bacterium ESL0693]